MLSRSIEQLSDLELRHKLLENGFPSIPITETTRPILKNKLKIHLSVKNSLRNGHQYTTRRVNKFVASPISPIPAHAYPATNTQRSGYTIRNPVSANEPHTDVNHPVGDSFGDGLGAPSCHSTPVLRAPVPTIRQSKWVNRKRFLSPNPLRILRTILHKQLAHLSYTVMLSMVMLMLTLLAALVYSIRAPHVMDFLVEKFQRFFLIVGMGALLFLVGSTVYYVYSILTNPKYPRAVKHFTNEILGELMVRANLSDLPAEREIVVDQLRDQLIPLDDRKRLLGAWNEAIAILEQYETRIQFSCDLRDGHPTHTMKWIGREIK